jgi:hypothetical protein
MIPMTVPLCTMQTFEKMQKHVNEKYQSIETQHSVSRVTIDDVDGNLEEFDILRCKIQQRQILVYSKRV